MRQNASVAGSPAPGPAGGAYSTPPDYSWIWGRRTNEPEEWRGLGMEGGERKGMENGKRGEGEWNLEGEVYCLRHWL